MNKPQSSAPFVRIVAEDGVAYPITASTSPLGAGNNAGAAKSTIVAAPATYQRIARVVGEAFDADQITPNCECCGLNEYLCECDPFYDPEPRKSREQIQADGKAAAARFAEAMFPNLRKPEGFERVEL